MVRPILGSWGDQSPVYKKCLHECQTDNCQGSRSVQIMKSLFWGNYWSSLLQSTHQLLLCSVITKCGHILAWRHGQFLKLFWIKRLGGLADKTVPTAACGARLKFMGSTAGLSHLNMMMIEVGHWLANLGSDRVPQFHGKWPFLRLGGMQEPVSSLIFPLTISIFTLRYLINYEEQLIALITFCVIGKRPSQLVKPGDQRLYDHLVHKKSFQPGCNVLGRFFSSPSV